MEEESGPYPLESEHVALKGNPDYHKLLSTIATLEAQRSKAIRDIDVLLQSKDDALKDPIAFVDKLQRGVDMGLPSRQKVAEIPQIDWQKYSDLAVSTNSGHRHGTRHQKQQSGSEQNSARSSRSNTPVPSTSQQEEDDSSIFIRGKRKNEAAKSSTFNKLWTVEEQARLEELLVKYPEEEVEARRWEKIAQALGNRTRQQVQSRVQKYFIRLAKEGMPIPGRIPHNLHNSVKRRTPSYNRGNRLLHQNSTFCASYKPPVYMSDDDDSSTSAYTPDTSFTHIPMTSHHVTVSDEEDIPEELRDSEEYKEILKIKKLKKKEDRKSQQQHIGYKCDRCGVEPIIGSRWHCKDCRKEASTDFCDACSDFVYETTEHLSWHRLTEVTHAYDSHLDKDYQHTQFISGDYNYLDPNFLPAT